MTGSTRVRLTKREREQLELVARELAEHGVASYKVRRGKRHAFVLWRGGRVTLSGTPSDRMSLIALRADVRKTFRGTR